ncbi:MAG TPA: hypothetical protein VJ063_07255 [Verrucomicrobiae bacterium]|nr:hypothetical protein [Verrucomicrobiae bacterium]
MRTIHRLNAAIAVTAGENICILVREFIPVNAPFNAQDQITVNAAFTYAVASLGPSQSGAVTFRVTVVP